MKLFFHRIYCAHRHFHLTLHPIAMVRFLKDPQAKDWCDALYRLIQSEPHELI